MFLRKHLEKIITQFAKDYFKNKSRTFRIALQRIKIKNLGDYATRDFSKIPDIELKNFLTKLLKTHSTIFSNVQSKNGFVNFYINDSFLIWCFKEYLKTNNYKLLNTGRGKKIIIEFLSANPTGRLHVGNARGGLLGDMLANLLQTCGFQVWREYYLQNAENSKQIQELGKSTLGMGSLYSSTYLNNIVKKIKITDKSPSKIGSLVADKIFEDQKKIIEKKLGIHFDNYFEERKLFNNRSVQEAFRLLKKLNLVFFKNGAWFLDSKKTGLQKDRVIIRQNKKPTYILVDLAYHIDKLIKRGFTKAINVWGADHQGHLLDLKAVLKAIKLVNHFQTILTHMVLLQTEAGPQKLSKRLGTLVDLEEFIDEFGIDAIRFFIAKYDPNKEIVLNLKLMKEKSFHNPLYYLQYSAVRANHILAKAAASKISAEPIKILTVKPEERELIGHLIDFDDIIIQSSRRLVIHPLVEQVLKLSERFNNFYEKCRVVDADLTTKNFRLLLTQKYLETVKLTCDILGISVPEKM